MKSEVLFRGKTADGEWYYGNLYKYNEKKMSIAYISENGGEYEADVIPETVGVFTGYRALNYEKIFEGDILKSMTGRYYLVTDAGYGKWNFVDIKFEYVHSRTKSAILASWRIVDNIHDSPDFAEKYWKL